MVETRSRSGLGEGLTITRRLKIMRRRTARWFLPRVRPLPEGHPAEEASEPDVPRYAARGVKPPHPLH
jgi:hypothetical protein